MNTKGQPLRLSSRAKLDRAVPAPSNKANVNVPQTQNLRSKSHHFRKITATATTISANPTK